MDQPSFHATFGTVFCVPNLFLRGKRMSLEYTRPDLAASTLRNSVEDTTTLNTWYLKKSR